MLSLVAATMLLPPIAHRGTERRFYNGEAVVSSE
jgi:hypothetical protein